MNGPSSWRDYLPVTRAEMRTAIAQALDGVWEYVAADTLATTAALNRLEDQMAADRELLATIAAGLTQLAVPITDLIAANATMRARIVELEGAAAADELGDLEAAQGVKTAFDDIAAKFVAEPTVPDVEPLPGPEPTPEPAPDEPIV